MKQKQITERFKDSVNWTAGIKLLNSIKLVPTEEINTYIIPVILSLNTIIESQVSGNRNIRCKETHTHTHTKADGYYTKGKVE